MISDPIFLISFCLFSVVVNLRVFWVVIIVSRRKLRPVSILVAHLSSVAICYGCVTVFYIMEKWGMANVSGPGLCELRLYLGYTTYTAFPLNVVSIIYESIRSSSQSQVHSGRYLILRMVFFIWIPAGLGSIPIIFMVQYEENVETRMGMCKPIPLMGEFSPTLIYELFRIILYHGMPVVYLLSAMFKIRSKVHYLYFLRSIPSDRLRRKVQRVRFVYVHCTVFILLWIPSGVLVFLLKILPWNGFGLAVIRYLTKVVIFLTLVFFLLSPITYVGFIERISAVEFCVGESCSKKCAPGRDNHVLDLEQVGNGPVATINYLELSRLSTVGQTGTSSDHVPPNTTLDLVGTAQPVDICVGYLSSETKVDVHVEQKELENFLEKETLV